MTDDSTEKPTLPPGYFRPPGQHPASRRVVGPDGTGYESLSHAAHVIGVGRTTLSARLGDPSSGWRLADQDPGAVAAEPVRLVGPEAATVIAALHAYAALLGRKPARDLRPILGSLVGEGQTLDAAGALRLCGALAVTPGLYGLAERLAIGRDVPVEPRPGPRQAAPEDEARHSSEPVGLNADD